MGIAIGIDLGTSNSAAAIYRRGKVESIPIDGKKILPSVVSFRDSNQVLVGQAAKARLYIDPEHSVASSKRYMGSDQKYPIQGKNLTPVDIAKEILKKVKEESSKFLGQEVTDAVITVPAYYTEEQRGATKKAAEQAGFKVLRLLPEPTAAAIAYGLEKERNQTIMVYDLGGGTFDVSILKVENNNFKVIAVDGDAQLGGDDFDETIIQYLLKQSNISLPAVGDAKSSIVKQQLKENAEELKKELSESEIADVMIPDVYGKHIDEEISREKFNQLIKPLLDRTLHKMQEVLKAAEMTKRDISRVILVGGSTRMPAVQAIVKEQVKQPYIADNVDEIVAHGAAILAANLSAPDLDNTPIEVEDVTAHSFGIDMINEHDEVKIYHLIKKNTPLPCRGSIMGWTLRPYQTAINMGVFRTEETTPREKDKIGELGLPVSSQPYHVASVSLFEIDENGILTFSSAEVKQGAKLIDSYKENRKVDMNLLDKMMGSKELKTKKVVIDTSKRGMKK